jgi:hypothetical protein
MYTKNKRWEFNNIYSSNIKIKKNYGCLFRVKGNYKIEIYVIDELSL